MQVYIRSNTNLPVVMSLALLQGMIGDACDSSITRRLRNDRLCSYEYCKEW